MLMRRDRADRRLLRIAVALACVGGAVTFGACANTLTDRSTPTTNTSVDPVLIRSACEHIIAAQHAATPTAGDTSGSQGLTARAITELQQAVNDAERSRDTRLLADVHSEIAAIQYAVSYAKTVIGAPPNLIPYNALPQRLTHPSPSASPSWRGSLVTIVRDRDAIPAHPRL
jgi:hypothetical protein